MHAAYEAAHDQQPYQGTEDIENWIEGILTEQMNSFGHQTEALWWWTKSRTEVHIVPSFFA